MKGAIVAKEKLKKDKKTLKKNVLDQRNQIIQQKKDQKKELDKAQELFKKKLAGVEGERAKMEKSRDGLIV